MSRCARAKFKRDRDIFVSFVRESEKNKIQIVRTCQETITDALEACFCFKGMSLTEYSVDTSPAGDAKFVDALKMALHLEERAVKFYSDAVRHSEGLLATIPSAFRRMADKRKVREQVLRSLFQKAITSE